MPCVISTITDTRLNIWKMDTDTPIYILNPNSSYNVQDKLHSYAGTGWLIMVPEENKEAVLQYLNQYGTVMVFGEMQSNQRQFHESYIWAVVICFLALCIIFIIDKITAKKRKSVA